MALLKKQPYHKKVNLAIIGAGEGGKLITKEILENPLLNYSLKAIIDEDIYKIGTNFREIPILGPITKIKQIIQDNQIDEILIAIPSATGKFIERVFNECNETDVEIKILPSYFEGVKYLERGIAGFEDIRMLQIEDFFRRKPPEFDLEKMKNYYRGKKILVTGGTGSIGSELCRQLLDFDIQKLITFDNRETETNDLSLDLRKKYGDKIIPLIADIRELRKLREIFKKYKPDIVFHAAAYKHVPLMEENPDEAIKNNVFGTQNIINLVEEFGVKDMLFISTDKAVNPESVMGASKRVAEMLLQDKSKKSNSKFVAVRFGNVINSQGSVVPLFEKQIKQGGPITVTHLDVKRFFMSIPEAIHLIIQSLVLGKTGDILILDMGEQVNIMEIAEKMIKLRGYKPYEDIDIKIIGLRRGDKLSEELLHATESSERTLNSRIFLVNTKEVDKKKLENFIDNVSNFLYEEDKSKLLDLIRELIPEFNLNLYRENREIPYCKHFVGEEEIKEVIDTLKGDWITMGPKTIKFEEQIANYIGTKHAIAVNSCTAAMHLSLLSLGIGEGDEVITTPYTFTATGNVIDHVKAKPVFVDITEHTLNIDPDKIERAITPKTKAILVVHYGGSSADLDKIKEIADRHNIKIIEDAAHAIGTKYKGRKIGSFGNLTCFSFYATKNMTTGEGGAIVTNDDFLAEKLRKMRLHGINKDAWKRYSNEGSWFYQVTEEGWKYNMTDIQAALGIPQLRKLDGFNNLRRKYAEIYDREFRNIPQIKLPFSLSDTGNVFHLYPILLEGYDRNDFSRKMKEKGIGVSVHFIPLHLHPFYQKKFGYKEGDFPIAEKVYNKEVSLPLYPKMTEEDVKYVIESIKEILNDK